jgi:hypothetical protein
MTASVIRQKLVNYMKVAEYKKVKAMYALFEDDIEQCSHISIEQYNQELDEAESEFENGEYITHDAMVKQVKQWQ